MQGLVVLVQGIAVRHHGPAHPQGGPAVLAHDGADDDAQIQGAPPVQVADGPRVHPALHRLQPVDDLQGLDLGGAGHAAPGVAGAHQVQGVAAGPQPGLHRADQLEHGGVILHRQQLGHLHGADARNPAQVVAHQIHDHQVLGPVLLAGGQLAAQAAVLFGGGAAGAGALDGAALGQAVGVQAQEALGRGADHLEPGKLQPRGEGRRVDGAQPPVQVPGPVRQRGLQLVSQAHLEHVAGQDVLPAALHRGAVAGRIEVGRGAAGPGLGHRVVGRAGSAPAQMAPPPVRQLLGIPPGGRLVGSAAGDGQGHGAGPVILAGHHVGHHEGQVGQVRIDGAGVGQGLHGVGHLEAEITHQPAPEPFRRAVFIPIFIPIGAETLLHPAQGGERIVHPLGVPGPGIHRPVGALPHRHAQPEQPPRVGGGVPPAGGGQLVRSQPLAGDQGHRPRPQEALPPQPAGIHGAVQQEAAPAAGALGMLGKEIGVAPQRAVQGQGGALHVDQGVSSRARARARSMMVCRRPRSFCTWVPSQYSWPQSRQRK